MKVRLVLALAAMMAFSAVGCDVRVGDKGGVFVDVDPRGRSSLVCSSSVVVIDSVGPTDTELDPRRYNPRRRVA